MSRKSQAFQLFIDNDMIIKVFEEYMPSNIVSERKRKMRRGQNIYHRKDGRWEGRCYVKGSRKYRSVYGRTCTEVKEKLQRLAGEDIVPSRKCSLRFSDIMQMWLANRKTEVKITSYYCYKHKLDKHILPYFGVRQYSTMTAADLELFKQDMLRRGYSDKYVADMVVMIKSAAKYAAEVHNYADLFAHVQPPKVKRREIVLLSEQQQKAFIKYCADCKSLTCICCFLTMFTGLRIGELCALKWDNIDIENRVLYVRNTIQRVPVSGQKSKTTVMLMPPKSETSVRDIPLPKFLVDMLKKYRQNNSIYLASGSCCPIEPRSFTNRFKALLKKAKVPSVKFHSLRHTFATNFLRQSGDVKSLSEILGHSGANITLRTYIHSSMARKSACMDMMQALI